MDKRANLLFFTQASTYLFSNNDCFTINGFFLGNNLVIYCWLNYHMRCFDLFLIVGHQPIIGRRALKSPSATCSIHAGLVL